MGEFNLGQFLTVPLPIMVTLMVTVWSAQWGQNKRLEDLRSDLNRRFEEINSRLDKIDKRLDRIEEKLDQHGDRITRLEERTSLVHR